MFEWFLANYSLLFSMTFYIHFFFLNIPCLHGILQPIKKKKKDIRIGGTRFFFPILNEEEKLKLELSL